MTNKFNNKNEINNEFNIESTVRKKNTFETWAERGKKARFYTIFFLQNRKSVNVGYDEMMTGTLQTNVFHGITNNKK